VGVIVKIKSHTKSHTRIIFFVRRERGKDQRKVKLCTNRSEKRRK